MEIQQTKPDGCFTAFGPFILYLALCFIFLFILWLMMQGAKAIGNIR